MEPVQLQLVIPFHQPLSMGPDELEEAYERFYEPFVEAIEARPELCLAVHFGGHLLDYLSRNHEEFLFRLRALHQAGRVEVLSGLFYGGLPALLPEADIQGQLQMGFEYWESVLGESPTGVWIPELAWTSEVPRFLSDTEALYGFGSSSQFQRSEYATRGLGVLERGGHKIATYLLDDTLSRSLVGADVDRWVDSVVDRARGLPTPVISVWVRGERLGFEPGSHAWAFERGWLDSFLTTLSGGRSEIKTVRPTDSFESVRPVTPLKLQHGCPDVIEPDAGEVAPVDWHDFLQNFREADTLARRMLRTSDKLRETVALMKEEELEDEWSGQLATAQRMLFSAQSPDAYWRGRGPGFADPLLRTATYSRLIVAERMIDALVQGADDFIAEEEDDRDGDLLDEIFIGTRHLTVWLDPNQGGRIRTVDDRLGGHSLLDVPPRHHETFLRRASEAPFATAIELEARGPRGPLDPLPRREQDLVLETDGSDRCGVRDWILDDGSTAAELFSGSACDLTPEFPEWQLIRSAIDEEGDLSFRLDTRATLPLAGVSSRTSILEKSIHIPIDEPEVKITSRVSEGPPGTVLFAMEVPIRLSGAQLFVDKQLHEPSQSEFYQAGEVSIRGEDGTVVQLSFSAPTDVWADRVRTTLKDVDGFRTVDQGFSIVVVLRVEGAGELTTTLRVETQGDHSPVVERAATAPASAEEAAALHDDRAVDTEETLEPGVDPVGVDADANDLHREDESEADDEYEYEYEEVDDEEEDDEYEYEYEEIDEDDPGPPEKSG